MCVCVFEWRTWIYNIIYTVLCNIIHDFFCLPKEMEIGDEISLQKKRRNDEYRVSGLLIWLSWHKSLCTHTQSRKRDRKRQAEKPTKCEHLAPLSNKTIQLEHKEEQTERERLFSSFTYIHTHKTKRERDPKKGLLLLFCFWWSHQHHHQKHLHLSSYPNVCIAIGTNKMMHSANGHTHTHTHT